MNKELKPCPFCGNKKVELKINKRLSACKVVCRNCGSKGTRFVRGITDENEEHMKVLAIGAWNMRANECNICQTIEEVKKHLGLSLDETSEMVELEKALEVLEKQIPSVEPKG